MEDLVLSEEHIVMLESLIKSPAFLALKRLLASYRANCQNELLSASDVQKIFQIQGRLIGLQVIENLPSIVVHQRGEKLKREAEAAKKQAELDRRLSPAQPKKRA